MAQKTTEYHTSERDKENASALLEQLDMDEEGQVRPIEPYLRLEHPLSDTSPTGPKGGRTPRSDNILATEYLKPQDFNTYGVIQ